LISAQLNHFETGSDKPDNNDRLFSDPDRRTRVEHRTRDLISALGIGSREHLAIVGAGGKTTLMMTLGRLLSEARKPGFMTTTTKVWKEQAESAYQALYTRNDVHWRERLRKYLASGNWIFLGQEVLENGKVHGILPELSDELFASEKADYILVEADGAAERPVKAPAEKEPVVPGSATCVVAVMGLEVLDRPLGPDLVFRPERVSRITGLQNGDRMSPVTLSRLFLHDEGLFKNAPPLAARTVFLNKLDRLPREEDARALSMEILSGPVDGVDRVVVGSLKESDTWTLFQRPVRP
jgi:probable selenium-dependent hydroxylase accessory protein YqeC